jgi:CRP-like cAMP-binding protein
LKALLLRPPARRDPTAASTMLARALSRTWDTTERPVGLVEFLGQVALFETLDHRERRRLARIVHERDYGDGEYICEEGKPGAALFVLRRGLVEVVKRDSDGRDVPLAVLEPPASFEESSAMGVDRVRWLSIRARGPVSLVALGKSDLDAMMVHFPTLANKVLLNLARVMAARLHVLIEAQDTAEPEEPSEPDR